MGLCWNQRFQYGYRNNSDCVWYIIDIFDHSFVGFVYWLASLELWRSGSDWSDFMNQLLIICGPTATGKTKLAFHLAKKFNGELISADSRQVYKGLDVLTGKDLPVQCQMSARQSLGDGGSNGSPHRRVAERGDKYQIEFHKKRYKLRPYLVEGVPVWMYDVVDADEEFSVSHYRFLASSIIDQIRKRGKLPIVVGGTGLYIRALTKPLDILDVPPDRALRTILSEMTVEQLQKKLEHDDPERWALMNHSDGANLRRLIRAIEIAAWKKNHQGQSLVDNPSIDTLMIGLSAEPNVLKENIRTRVIARLDSGVTQEIKIFFATHNTSGLPAQTALGLHLVKQHIHGELSKDALIDTWTRQDYAYARRQMTWFGKDRAIHWVDSAKKDLTNTVEKLVRQWYTHK